MALNLLLGPSGSGKTHKLFEYALSEARKHPDINYYVIVPEQFTLKTQRQLVDMSDCHGILNVDVLSFARLCIRIFDEVGFQETSGVIMDDMGKNLVVRHIAMKEMDNLPYLSDNMKKLGYITEVKSLISEFKQYKIGDEELDKMISLCEDNGKTALYRKLSDVRRLYNAFDAYIKDKYTTTEELLDIAAREAYKSNKLRNSVILLDGFTGFTPVQYGLLEALMQTSKEIFISLVTDTRDDVIYNTEHELFYLTYETENKLRKLAERNNINISDVILKETINKRFSEDKKHLIHLERNIFREYKKPYINSQKQGAFTTGVTKLPTKTVNDEIALISMLSPADEVKKMAQNIKKMVIDQGYRYRDIAIVTGDMENYIPLIQRIFPKYGIPFFSDKKNPVLLNPFIEYLRAFLDIITEDFSYESMFRFLRSAISEYKTDDIDILENFVLKNGIKGFFAWNTNWENKYSRNCKKSELEQLKIIEITRDIIVNNLLDTWNNITDGELKNTKKPTKTVNELNACIYSFLERNNIQKRLYDLANEYCITDVSFTSERKKEFEKVYTYTIDLMDKMCELLGDEIISISEYGELLDAGFDEIRIGLIPGVTDYVQVGDIVRSRFSDIRALYIVGANDGIIPGKSSGGGILSDIEKDFILDKSEGITLAPTSRMQTYTGQLYLYMLMTKPKDRLFISYSRLNTSSESIKPSYLIKTIAELFPGILIERDIDDPLEGVFNYETAFERAVEALSEDDTSNALLNYFYNNADYKDRMIKIIDSYLSIGVLEGKDSISKAVASVLYGSELKGSVTKLERFAECAYRHFLENGLSLKERELFDFKAPDMGNLFHSALENYSKLLNENDILWTNITPERREDYIKIAVNEALESGNFDVLYSSFRNKYMINRMQRIVRRSVDVLTEHLSKGEFMPLDAEVEFSSLSNLSAFNFQLSETERMHLSGKIDRIDTFEDSEHLFVKIIDYKSGNKKFNLLEIYKGLSLQLVVYLNAAVEMLSNKTSKEIVPAGILYYHVDDPMVDINSESTSSDIANKIYSELKLRGMVNDSEDVYRLMDRDFEKSSLVIPVTLKQDGSFAKEASVASSEDFKILSEYVNKKVQDIGKDILSGNIKALPQSIKGQDDKACGYCPYKSICKYDSLPQDEQDEFGSKDKDEIIAKMKEEISL